MSLRQKAVQGVVWSAIESWGRQVISFLVFSLLARILGPETFGVIALASVFLSFVQLFLDQGFSIAIIQRQKLDSEHLDTAFWVSVGTSLLLTLLSVACAPLVASFFKEPQLTLVIYGLSLNFLLTGLSSVQNAILQRKLAFKALALRSILSVIAGGSVGIGMAFAGFGVWSLVGQQLVNGVVQVLTLWWISDWKPRLRFSSEHFKELFSFGINVVGINFLNFINQNSSNLLIGYYLGSVALGYYAVAYRILTVVSQLMISVIQKVAMPIFSRLQQEPEKMENALYKAIQLTNLVAFPVFAGMSVLAPDLITVMFGQQWSPSIPVLQVLSIIGLLYAGFYYNGPVLMALGKPSWNLLINLIQAVGNVIGFAIAVKWGITAVAAAYVIRAFLSCPIPIWMLYKLIHIRIATYLNQYTVPLVGSLVMVAIITGAKALLGDVLNVQVQLLIYIAIGIAAYVLMLLLIAPKLVQKILELFRSVLRDSRFKKV